MFLVPQWAIKSIVNRMTREKKPPLTRVQEASDPKVILKQIRHLRWAYREGYRPVPGYTIAERREDGTLYLAIEMTKDPRP